MPIIRTTEGHRKIPSEDTLFDSGGEGGQLSTWHQMMACAGYVPILLWSMTEWPALQMHSIVVMPGLAKSLSGKLDLWDNLWLTYTVITTNSKNRVEQHLTICHQPGHGYHIYLSSIDCLNYLYWLLDLKRTYFYNTDIGVVPKEKKSKYFFCFTNFHWLISVVVEKVSIYTKLKYITLFASYKLVHS